MVQSTIPRVQYIHGAGGQTSWHGCRPGERWPGTALPTEHSRVTSEGGVKVAKNPSTNPQFLNLQGIVDKQIHAVPPPATDF